MTDLEADPYPWARRARPLHEPRRCVVLDKHGVGLAYRDTIDDALRAAKSIPRAHTIADAASGTTFAKYYGTSREVVRLPWEPDEVEGDEPGPEEGESLEDEGD